MFAFGKVTGLGDVMGRGVGWVSVHHEYQIPMEIDRSAWISRMVKICGARMLNWGVRSGHVELELWQVV